jgi:hypothetical protein
MQKFMSAHPLITVNWIVGLILNTYMMYRIIHAWLKTGEKMAHSVKFAVLAPVHFCLLPFMGLFIAPIIWVFSKYDLWGNNEENWNKFLAANERFWSFGKNT